LNEGDEKKEVETPPPAPTRAPSGWRTGLRKWAFVAVPAIGLLEIGLHARQTFGAVPASDWRAAHDVVKSMVKPEDLVLVAPRWADPLGRQYLGAEILTPEREGRADETAFPRAIEVSIRGAHAPELEGWRRAEERKVGKVTITTFENPSPVTVLDRLLAHEGPDKMQVFRIDGEKETECTWVRGAPQAGNLGFGPAIPGSKFSCPGGAFVGVSVIATLDYTPRRCFYAPPSGGGGVLRIKFKDVAFGHLLHAHHGIYVEAERHKDGAPVTLAFSVDDKVLARVVHNDGDGWKGFELPTEEYAGQRKDLVADITSPNGNRRMYCFEADTR
jgi:hypothetical protein